MNRHREEEEAESEVRLPSGSGARRRGGAARPTRTEPASARHYACGTPNAVAQAVDQGGGAGGAGEARRGAATGAVVLRPGHAAAHRSVWCGATAAARGMPGLGRGAAAGLWAGRRQRLLL